MTMRRDVPGRRVRDVLLLCLPTMLAAVLAFVDLSARSIWLDESASITIAEQHGAALGAAMAHDGGNMLAYYALLHVLIAAFGDATFVVRAPSAIAAAGCVALVTVLARRLYGTGVALAAGLLSAVSLPLVYWGQDARGYAIMTALVAGSSLALLATSDAAEEHRPLGWRLASYLIVTTLAIYTGFIAVLVIPAQLLALVLSRRRTGAALGAMAVTVLAGLPLALLARARGSGQLFWVPAPGATAFHDVADTLTSAALVPVFDRSATSAVLLWSSLAALAVAIGVVVRRTARRATVHGRCRPDAGAARSRGLGDALLVCWLVVPVVLAAVESAIGQSIFVPRNLLVALPPVTILLAAVTVGPLAPRRVARTAGWPLAAAFLALRAVQLAPTYAVSPENWRAAAHYVLARAQPGDCIAFYPADGRMAFAYYFDAHGRVAPSSPRPVLPSAPWSTHPVYVEDYATLGPAGLRRVARTCPRLWLVASHQGQRSGTAASRADLARYHRLVQRLDADLRGRTTARFGYAAVIDVALFARPAG